MGLRILPSKTWVVNCGRVPAASIATLRPGKEPAPAQSEPAPPRAPSPNRTPVVTIL